MSAVNYLYYDNFNLIFCNDDWNISALDEYFIFIRVARVQYTVYDTTSVAVSLRFVKKKKKKGFPVVLIKRESSLNFETRYLWSRRNEQTRTRPLLDTYSYAY